MGKPLSLMPRTREKTGEGIRERRGGYERWERKKERKISRESWRKTVSEVNFSDKGGQASYRLKGPDRKVQGTP